VWNYLKQALIFRAPLELNILENSIINAERGSFTSTLNFSNSNNIPENI